MKNSSKDYICTRQQRERPCYDANGSDRRSGSYRRYRQQLRVTRRKECLQEPAGELPLVAFPAGLETVVDGEPKS